jgi:hypothetical protein
MRGALQTVCPPSPIGPFPVLALAIWTLLLMGVLPAVAQPEAIRCLRPQPPMTALPDEVLAEHLAEIGAESEAYFAAIYDHIACLDEERARALDAAHAATEAYTTLINAILAAKDRP